MSACVYERERERERERMDSEAKIEGATNIRSAPKKTKKSKDRGR